MHVNMRHTLARSFTILYCYIERVRVIDALEGALYARDGLKEVCDLGCA
jgi:hypothetical protein